MFLSWEWVKAREEGLRVDVESLADFSREVGKGGEGNSNGPSADCVVDKSLAGTWLEM